MSRLREEFRFRFVLLAGLLLLPYWYLRFHSAGVDPVDFFLGKLAVGNKSRTRPVVLAVVLGMAARNFDAPSALAAIKRLESPLPFWALSLRHIRLLLEAPLWLSAPKEYELVRSELMRAPAAWGNVRGILASYDAIARNEMGSTERLKDELVLPALHWERLAGQLWSDRRIGEAREALYEALRYIPETDSRRAELVARLVQADAVSHSMSGDWKEDRTSN